VSRFTSLRTAVTQGRRIGGMSHRATCGWSHVHVDSGPVRSCTFCSDRCWEWWWWQKLDCSFVDKLHNSQSVVAHSVDRLHKVYDGTLHNSMHTTKSYNMIHIYSDMLLHIYARIVQLPAAQRLQIP